MAIANQYTFVLIKQNAMNTLTIIENSTLRGKMLSVAYRPDESFIIAEEIKGGNVIALANNGTQYCFDLDDEDIEVIG